MFIRIPVYYVVSIEASNTVKCSLKIRGKTRSYIVVTKQKLLKE